MSPETRREVWLSVALAVARDGLPAPEQCAIRDSAGGMVDLDFEGIAEATLWAEALQLRPNGPVMSTDGKRRLWWWSGERAGMSWTVNAREPVTSAVVEDLAAQVVDAIVGNTEAGDQ